MRQPTKTLSGHVKLLSMPKDAMEIVLLAARVVRLSYEKSKKQNIYMLALFVVYLKYTNTKRRSVLDAIGQAITANESEGKKK